MVGDTREQNCDSKNSACDGSAGLIRRLSDPGMNEASWCALFVSTLANIADREAGGGPQNVIHDGPHGNASEYASAYKLRSKFDPKFLYGTNKKSNAFLPADKKPIPGCMAIYQNKKEQDGHMGLVISSSGAGLSGTMDTIEGNSSPVKGSSKRGAFLHPGRAWGEGAFIESPTSDGKGTENLYYKGCVMPWPDMAKSPVQTGCSSAVADSHLKPYEFTGFHQQYPNKPSLPANAGGAEDFLRNWIH